MMQMSIFEANSMVRRDDPDTSARAAVKALEFKGRHEGAIFGAICDAGNRGATAKEIAAVTRLTDVQVNRRLGAMGARGVIERSSKTDCSGFDARNGCAIWWKT